MSLIIPGSKKMKIIENFCHITGENMDLIKTNIRYWKNRNDSRMEPVFIKLVPFFIFWLWPFYTVYTYNRWQVALSY